jgi:mannose-6-phosphate isomerase-like protein (cupin superfamily)
MRGLSRPGVTSPDPSAEFFTDERCHILVSDAVDDDTVSIARARVEPGVTTAWHSLTGVDERYVLISGEGLVEIGDDAPTRVGAGDVVAIPSGERQRIINTGLTDLIFLCICTPPFTPDCYVDLDG